MQISNEDKNIMRRILYLFKPHTKKVGIILICMLLSAGISMVIPRLSQQLMDKGLLARNYKLLIVFTLASTALFLIDQGLGFLETKNRIYLNSIITYTLSKNAFKHTLQMKMNFFHNSNASEIMSTIGMDVSNIGRICDSSTFYILSSILKMVGGMIGLLLIDWRLTIMVVVIVPFRYILVKYIAKKRKHIFEEYIEVSKSFAAFYGDSIAGVKEIKLWNMDRIKMGEYIREQRKIIKANINLGLIDKLNEFSESVLFQVVMDFIYIVGAFLVFESNLTIGELFAFITYSSYVTGPISALLNIGYNFVNIIPSAKRYFEFMDKEGEPYRGLNIHTQVREDAKKEVIAFRDVSFSYRDDTKVLDQISFEINNGEKIAIVGANGSGKSTMINLLLRFYQPDEGKILMNGTDINTMNLREYRKLISVVSQDVHLFYSSIKDNIVLNSKMPEKEIYEAIKECGVSEFVEKLPDKYNTIVGRNGTKMSGGERQKIALARALVRESQILILDEATANYDMEAEAAINKFIGNDLKEKTAIIISHKPDILKYVDKVILLEKGRIVDIGKHEELFQRSSTYKKMMENHDTFKEDSFS
jgi:ATP-binding cassette, subfamily B, bacterial